MNAMGSSLQENVLTLLCFDLESANTIRGYVTPDLFEGDIYQTIVTAALDFLDKYKDVPGDHLPDLIEPLIKKTEGNKKELFERTLLSLYQFKDSINKEYALNELTKFVRQQKLKQTLTSAVKNVQSGNIDEAEAELSNHLKTSLDTFDIGLSFADFPKKYDSIFGEQAECFSMGIPSLESMGIGPARKELFTILTLPSRGKTWFEVHLAKMGMMHRLRVLYVTLEMSEVKIAGRFLQCLFSMTRRKVEGLEIPVLEKDELGRFMDIDFHEVSRPSCDDKNIKEFLNRKMRYLGSRYQLVIKQFPPNTLTIRGLEAYLDLLERQANFIPDVVCVDYPDLMKLDAKNVRIETGIIYKGVRSVAVDRNLAMVAASQSSKEGKKVRWIDMENFAEDYSKAGISDTIISYNQSDSEYKLGLARLLVAKTRDEARNVKILIAQSYKIGQFVLDSVKMESEGSYFKKVFQKSSDEDEEEET
jgi:replicative DNA helicase